MKNLKSYILLILLFFVGNFSLFSQSVTVEATIDSAAMRIGEQRHILLEVVQPQKSTVHFPIVSETDTLVPGVEILGISKLDTIVESGTRIRIKQDLLVTSFDTGRYEIPPFKFMTKLKELETQKLYLHVSTIEADFQHAQITDIEENYAPGFNWVRLFLYLSVFVMIACAVFLGYVIYQYIKRKKAIENQEIVVEDTRLPHEIALEELNEIQEEKVWKQGFTKQYYTNITDTLREYFVKRFKISAFEMTSDEILDSLKYNQDAAPVMDKMKQIFFTSDMVKFAKQEPSQEENELSILNAYKIVNDTKIIPVEEEKKEKRVVEASDKEDEKKMLQSQN